MTKSKQAVLKELQMIPGVGKSIAADLWELGIRSVKGLKRKDPEKLYLNDVHRWESGSTLAFYMYSDPLFTLPHASGMIPCCSSGGTGKIEHVSEVRSYTTMSFSSPCRFFRFRLTLLVISSYFICEIWNLIHLQANQIIVPALSRCRSPHL